MAKLRKFSSQFAICVSTLSRISGMPQLITSLSDKLIIVSNLVGTLGEVLAQPLGSLLRLTVTISAHWAQDSFSSSSRWTVGPGQSGLESISYLGPFVVIFDYVQMYNGSFVTC